MNKPLFTFTIVLLISFSFSSQAATNSVAEGALNGTAGAVSYVTGSTILNTLIPSQKKCNYVRDKNYEPFSNIDSSFPGAQTLKMDANGCINVAGATENILNLLFVTGISIIIVLTVISISIAGIQYMTEQATGQVKGGAKKRLQNSFIALGLGLLSYTILYTINKQLVDFSFNPVSIDIDHSIDKGIQDANISALSSSASSALISAAVPATLEWRNRYTGAPCTPVPTPIAAPGYVDPCIQMPVAVAGPYSSTLGSTPSWGETTTPGNFPTYASYGSINCTGAICSSSRPTVFGYLDGNGTVGRSGDNGIGNASWSTKPGCTADTGNTITMGLALPQGFYSAAGIPTSEVKYLGIKLYINGVAQRILPIVDDSQENLDFTFAAAKAYLDPTIVDSNHINTAGKNVTFEIIRNYYLTNPKDTVIYTSNKSTFANKIPCTI